MMLLGIGAGVCFPALMTIAMAGATPEDAGLASGLVNTTAQVGGALGLAVLATLSASRSEPAGKRSLDRGRADRRLPPRLLDRGRLVGCALAVVASSRWNRFAQARRRTRRRSHRTRHRQKGRAPEPSR